VPRILITGAGGFTGRYVAALLMKRSHELYGIVHAKDGDVENLHRVYEADLAHLPSISRIVDEVRPDHVVHLAGIAFVAHSDVEQIYRSNVLGTRQLLEALVGLTYRPRSILLASSANVYGNAREGELDEGMSFAPTNDYAVSKVAMEYVAALYRRQLPLIVVRPFNYTGRDQSEQFIIPKIVAHARERAPLIELGNLEVARDFSDVRAVAQIYERLLGEPKAIGGTYNVCSGRAVSLQHVLEMVWRLSGHRFEVRVNAALVRTHDVRVLQGSKDKLESLIGPLPAIPLEETLRWMLEA
jgi:nucleoside-diphosphate-sugar epimerase